MEADTLLHSLELICGVGLDLSPEQQTSLQNSLIHLKRNYRFTRVLLWGKIQGIRNHYFIAKGVGEDEIRDRKFLYSINCIDWHLLPIASEALTTDVDLVANTRFIGDPSFQYRQRKKEFQEQGDHAVEDEVRAKANEEKRLAVTVLTIDKEAVVVPRGAYVKSPLGTVPNRSFTGLNPREAAKLNNYFHFSEPKNPRKRSVLEMPDLIPSIDFLEPLSDDMPRGMWCLQLKHNHKVCVIQSLLWPGLTVFHEPSTTRYGYFYNGNGIKNLDLLWTGP